MTNAPSGRIGVEDFDHGDVAALPEYIALSRAMDDFVHKLNAISSGWGQAKWMREVVHMAATLQYTDSAGNRCTVCRELARATNYKYRTGHAPAKVAMKNDGESLSAWYVCAHGYRWGVRHWATDQPNWS